MQETRIMVLGRWKILENLQLVFRGAVWSLNNIDYLSTEKIKTEFNPVANPVFKGSCYPSPQIHPYFFVSFCLFGVFFFFF